jgi:hypothetical protein
VALHGVARDDGGDAASNVFGKMPKCCLGLLQEGLAQDYSNKKEVIEAKLTIIYMFVL